MQHYLVTRGEKALQDAATSGQYRVPDGMFYGGSAPCWSTLQMRGIVSRHAAGMSRLVWIDLHTGLGHYGHGEKIFNSPDPAAAAAGVNAAKTPAPIMDPKPTRDASNVPSLRANAGWLLTETLQKPVRIRHREPT